MEVQRVLFPGEECGEPEMYFRGIPPSAIDPAGGTVLVRRGETVSLDTYFNSFSAGKWRRYTRLGNLIFRFHLEHADGRGTGENAGGGQAAGTARSSGGGGPGCRVRIVHAVAEADAEGIARLRRDENFRSDIEETSRRIAGLVRVREEELPFALETSRDGGRTSCECRIGGIPEDGILYAEIAPEAGALVGGMSWRTDADGIRLNRVRLALGICTFRREEAASRTVRKLEAAVARGGDSGPWDELAIYVADNGRTLGPDAFPSGRVRLLPNPNLGGSAGFARTMIEAVFHGREEDFTHIVLMDDDVVLSPDTVERTYTFLRFVREEYGESMLGGAMFHEDRRHYQHESGALFDGTR
ncbi:MAG: glycosyltransferase, partial [Treponema sp.]|nr:glycosyltransferase [Treponema sp.]